MAKRAAFPQLPLVQDQALSQSLRLFWDRLFACEQTAAACQGVTTQMRNQVARLQPTLRDLARTEALLRRGS